MKFLHYPILVIFTSLILVCYGTPRVNTDEWRIFALENAAYKAGKNYEGFRTIAQRKYENLLIKVTEIITHSTYESMNVFTFYEQGLLLKHRNPNQETYAETEFYRRLIALRERQSSQYSEEEVEPPCNHVRWHVELDEESFEEHHASRHHEREEISADYSTDTATCEDQPQDTDVNALLLAHYKQTNLTILDEPHDFGTHLIVRNNAQPNYNEAPSSTPLPHIASTSIARNNALPTYNEETSCSTPPPSYSAIGTERGNGAATPPPSCSDIVHELFLRSNHQTHAREQSIDPRLLDQPPSLGILPTPEIPREEGDFVPYPPET